MKQLFSAVSYPFKYRTIGGGGDEELKNALKSINLGLEQIGWVGQ